jgi:hypothetical protein
MMIHTIPAVVENRKPSAESLPQEKNWPVNTSIISVSEK